MAKSATNLHEPSVGTVLIAEYALGLAPSLDQAGRSVVRRARVACASLGGVLAALEKAEPHGARIPLEDWTRLGKELSNYAEALQCGPYYRAHGCPPSSAIEQFCRFRFRSLDAYHLPDRSQLNLSIDPIVEEALRVCLHPTLDDIVAAFRSLWTIDALSQGNNKTLARIWRRDFRDDRASLANHQIELDPRFEEKYALLVNEVGGVCAVLMVIEQAFEFERSQAYLSQSMAIFAGMKGTHRDKGITFGDQDPNVVQLALIVPHLIIPAEPESLAIMNYEALDGAKLEGRHARAPEGERYHFVLGASPLVFALTYLFHTFDRFEAFVAPSHSDRFTRESAMFRIALNMLAQVSEGEAFAELEFALRKSPTKAPGGLKISRAQFDLLQAQTGQPLAPWVDDPDWGAHWVRSRRKRYDHHRAHGLFDENRNPFACAFPDADAWSRERNLGLLESAWYRARYALETIDYRYAPPGHRQGHPLKKQEVKVSLKMAAVLAETPTAMTIARSLALSDNEVSSWVPRGDAW